MTEISIIVPLYNKSKYLNGMIDSVLKQSFSDFELIIVDDGSTDDSGKIADDYAAKDSRVKVCHIPNQGVSHARNIGLDMSEGTYITFLDSDDSIGPCYLNKLYTSLTENNAVFVIGGLSKVWRDSRKTIEIKPPYTGKKSVVEILGDFAQVQKNTGIYGFCTSKMFSRDVLGDTRFDEQLKLAEDFDFYLKLYRKVKEICFCNNTDYYYLQETENSPLNVRDEDIDYFSQLLIQIRLMEFLKDMGAYSCNNCETVERNISMYMYFTLHYASPQRFNELFRKTYQLLQENDIHIVKCGFRQNLVLRLLKKNRRIMTSIMIGTYHQIRKLFSA